jgi:alpha-glucosidase
MVADQPAALVSSTLVDDLAAPSRVADAGWVAPGKSAWGWWSGLLARGVAHPGHNDATYRHYIDFAGRFGLPYYLVDRGWAWRGDGSDPVADITRTTDGVNMPALIRYARARHVRLWLWVNWKALDGRMEQVLSLYQRMGIAGIKVDYLYRQDQGMVAFYHRLLASAARHRLMVDIHAAFVPRGLDRTYPNFVTQEGVMGVEYNRWSRRDTAQAHVELAYGRAAIGPMDYAPGAFRNVAPARFVARPHAPEVMTTRAHQLALFVVFPSPLTVLADDPAAYENGSHGLAPGADFVKLVPTAWDETRGIAGEFGHSVAVARRRGRRWYVGLIADGHARRIALPLGFLGSGRWRVASWCDGVRPDAVVTRMGELTAGRGHLVVPMAANGGAALVLEPAA